MILGVNYSDSRFQKAQKFNTKMALKNGVDNVMEWNRDKLPEEFKEKNKELLSVPRGGGYWIWKPYVVRQSMDEISDGDYIFYCDSGCALVRPIKELIDNMETEKTDVMCFCINKPEVRWAKRDALILMDCDRPEFLWSAQICATFFILKKNPRTVALMDEYVKLVQDPRIVSDNENVMGKPNYDDFKENRHDQTVWSLLCKRNGIKPFRDPSQHGLNKFDYTNDVLARSYFPQMFVSHKNENIISRYELHYQEHSWYRIPRFGIKIYNKIKETQ